MKHSIILLLFLYGNSIVMNSFSIQQNLTKSKLPVQDNDTINLNKTNIEKYLKAYRHIVADSLFKCTSVCVSDKTIGSNYIYFIDELKKNGYLKEKSEITVLYEMDAKSGSKFICWDRIIQNETKNKCVYMLSFSDIEKNDLFAEIKIKEWGNTPFGDSIIYFFRFNPDGSFNFIYRIELSGL